MEQIKKIATLIAVLIMLSSAKFSGEETTFSLTVQVSELQNSKGEVQFSLYNKAGSIPDEHFKQYYKQLKAKIKDNSSFIIFKNLPKGHYAVNVLHDENENGVIDKGWFLPVEGIGFSNLKSINPMNRPSFKKAKFKINSDKTVKVKIIYM